MQENKSIRVRKENIKLLISQIKSTKIYVNPKLWIDKVKVLYALLIEDDRLLQADEYAKLLIESVTKEIMIRLIDHPEFNEVHETLRRAYFYLGSRGYFHYFLLGMELDRPKEKKFYANRVSILKEAVDALQELYDRKLDFLSIELPPRTGKTTLGLFFLAMCIGSNPNRSSLAISYATTIAGSFYDGVYDFITDEEYNFRHIFPNAFVVDKSDKEMFLDLVTANRYKSLTFRSIDGQITGSLEANDILYLDDLIQNIEEAKNPDRLAKACDKVRTDLFQRRKPKQGCVTLAIGTNWSVDDPLYMLKELNRNNPKAKFVIIPALDYTTDESNFDYPHGLGFDTEYYRDLRDNVYKNDPVTFSCVYQQLPKERVDLTFEISSLKRYTMLPKGKPDYIISYTDVAFGGGDDCVTTIGAAYGEDMYILDFVVDGRDYSFTEVRVANAINQYKVQIAEFESDNGGMFYAKDVALLLKQLKSKCRVKSNRQLPTSAKYVRIEQFAPDIKSYFYLSDTAYEKNSDYYKAMILLGSFSSKSNPKTQKDDVPDSLAGLSNMRKLPTKRRRSVAVDRTQVKGYI